MKKAVVLLSGGLDSATTAAIAKADGYELYALSIDYGQRHKFELESAAKVAEMLCVAEHKVLQIGLGELGGSALTADLPVPHGRDEAAMSHGIPITYVPARNTVFLSLALGYAEVVGAADLFIGVNAVDYSGYPDCRPEFITAFETVANLATKAGIEGTLKFRIHTPLINLTKSEIIRRGLQLGVDYGLTHTCYSPAIDGKPCGDCDACQLRLKGFAELGLIDPGEDSPQRAQRAQREEGEEKYPPRFDLNEISGEIVDAAISVHRQLGPGLLESTYEAGLAYELMKRGRKVERQVAIPVRYDNLSLECGYRADLLVDEQVIVELKAVDQMHPTFNAQLLSHLKLSGKKLGLLLNFNVERMKQGITRITN
jgi:7-cyano-7-deazaguanine synthase